jgi:competence protein ComEC
MIPAPLRSPPHSLLALLCLGIALANLVRLPTLVALGCAAAIGLAASSWRAVATIACLLVVAGWWWGSARLERLDHSALRAEVGRAERALVVVTAAPRRGRFDLKMPVRVRRFGLVALDEPAQLELPLGRAPPQGGILEVRAEAKLPRGPSNGFDERTWLRRHGIHVVLAGDRWRLVGHRRGLGGFGDGLRGWLANSVAGELHGERRGVLLGVVLGDEQGLNERLRKDFRASGLYHLLAVSGQNVALVAAGALILAWLLGIPRWLGQLGALASIGGYVLAVGAQPSVVRAGVAGGLGSVAWLTARSTDRWYFLLLGALALLAWNPYVLFDAGFQLSFAAVVAIFTLAPRLEQRLEGYPPAGLAPRGNRDLDRLRSGDCSDPLAAVPRDSAACRAGKRGRRTGRRSATWARDVGGRGPPARTGHLGHARAGRRALCGLSRGLREGLRQAAVRADPLRLGGRGVAAPRRRGVGLCLPRWQS